jgi:hypothetical protein
MLISNPSPLLCFSPSRSLSHSRHRPPAPDIDKKIPPTLTCYSPDIHTELENVGHMQYFCFRSFVSGLVPMPSSAASAVVVTYVISNASDVSFPDAWPGSSVCYNVCGVDSSYDDDWRRNLTTEYDNDDFPGALTWKQVHETNGSTYFSYWPPYSYDRHLKLISDCWSRTRRDSRGAAMCTYDPVIESLGTSIDGREIECLSLGNGNLNAWIQHRQHPGETMAGELKYSATFSAHTGLEFRPCDRYFTFSSVKMITTCRSFI